ncbi:MAG: hypothetical protein KDA90_06615 [Planctomycetaceae bacterium]|nr:hypothetical protein [Planctomycetaceae bacterium]
MTRFVLAFTFGTFLTLASACDLNAQDEVLPPGAQPAPAAPAASKVEPTTPASPSSSSNLLDQVESQMDPVKDKVSEVAREVDQNKTAQEVSAGILQPIYALAEACAGFPFYWSAFTVMVIGVVGFGLQLVLGKLVMLAKFKFSLTEAISDAIGLIISLIGLVLTTQAATENSTFPQSPFAVLSATAIGTLVGLYFYKWGQAQELRAAAAPKPAAKK